MISDCEICMLGVGKGLGNGGRAFGGHDRRSLSCERRRTDITVDELVMPKLRGQHADQCLVLAEPGGKSGTTAPYQPGDGDRGEHSHSTNGIRGEMVANPLGGVCPEEA